MANEKLVSSLITIDRALGIIEGVSVGLAQPQADMLIAAVEMIELSVKEITDGSKQQG